MAKKSLYIGWAALFAVCAGLGFLPEPAGAAKVLCIIFALACFVPPALIVYLGWKEKDKETLRLVRNLAIGSLVVTLLMLIGNFLTLAAPEWVGNVLYAVLVMVSSPMVCGQIWIISLLLWAALMWTCILLLGKRRD